MDLPIGYTIDRWWIGFRWIYLRDIRSIDWSCFWVEIIDLPSQNTTIPHSIMFPMVLRVFPPPYRVYLAKEQLLPLPKSTCKCILIGYFQLIIHFIFPKVSTFKLLCKSAQRKSHPAARAKRARLGGYYNPIRFRKCCFENLCRGSPIPLP